MSHFSTISKEVHVRTRRVRLVGLEIIRVLILIHVVVWQRKSSLLLMAWLLIQSSQATKMNVLRLFRYCVIAYTTLSFSYFVTIQSSIDIKGRPLHLCSYLEKYLYHAWNCMYATNLKIYTSTMILKNSLCILCFALLAYYILSLTFFRQLDSVNVRDGFL